MNDLMTSSFLNYVELKRQSMKDVQSEPDLEMGKLDPIEEQNLSKFFEEVNAIKADMEQVTNLLTDLRDLNKDSKFTHATKLLKGIRGRINSDMVTILRKAKNIRSRLEALDRSNQTNRKLSMAYKEGSYIDRTRISVTNGLRTKFRDMMIDFQEVREMIVKDHKEGLKRWYYNMTGEEAGEDLIEEMMLGGGQEKIFEGKGDMVKENRERNEAFKEILRSLTELHQVFLDMAVLVGTQGDEINNIEVNVASAKTSVNGGTNALFYAKQIKKQRNWTSWIGIFLLIILVILVAALGS